MQRKIIQQSATSMGISLPSKWIRENNLQKGSVLTLELNADMLTVRAQSQPPKKSVTLRFPDTHETYVRMKIINAYRNGYDSILVYDIPSLIISAIIDRYLIGFEIIHSTDNVLTVESVAEPNYERFQQILEKQILMVKEQLLTVVDSEAVVAERIQKYDNFLRRCIAKQLLTVYPNYALWQLLSQLTHLSRTIQYLHTSLAQVKQKPLQTIILLGEYYALFADAFFKKSENAIIAIHAQRTELTKRIHRQIRDPLLYHQCATIVNQIYYLSSALDALIQTISLTAPEVHGA